jgi:hypothetical protein
MLQVQSDAVARRARLIRRCLQCLLSTIICLSLCSIAVGLSVAWPAAMYAAVPSFILGLVLLVTGVVYAMIELERALDPVELESRFVADLAAFEADTGPGMS